jgi:hypothetical protein
MEISEVALIGCCKSPYNVVIKLEALMNMSPFLTVNLTCDRTLPWVSQQLLKVGLRSVQTFDLHIARTALHGCECPHHGTDQCDCQMVVLLVYGATNGPVTLILHGNNGQTWLSIPNGTASNPTLASQIQNSLQTGSLPVVK